MKVNHSRSCGYSLEVPRRVAFVVRVPTTVFQGGGSGVVSVSCFGDVSLFVCSLVQFWLLNGHLLGNSCPLG